MGLIDDLTGKSAADKQGRMVGRAVDALKRGRDEGGDYIAEGRDLISGGVDDILSRVMDMQRSAKNDAYDAYQMELGSLTQNLVGTGRYSTSGADAMRLQALGSMQKTFTDIDSSLAGVYSNIGLQGLSMEVGQLNEQANFLARAQEGIAGVRSGVQFTGGGGLSALLGAAGTGLGFALGGPAGAKIGGSIGGSLGEGFSV